MATRKRANERDQELPPGITKLADLAPDTERQPPALLFRENRSRPTYGPSCEGNALWGIQGLNSSPSPVAADCRRIRFRWKRQGMYGGCVWLSSRMHCHPMWPRVSMGVWRLKTGGSQAIVMTFRATHLPLQAWL